MHNMTYDAPSAASEEMLLSNLREHQKAYIKTVAGDAALRQHLLDMGLVPGAIVEYIKRAPLGDPIEFRIRNYQLSLREEDAKLVTVALMSDEDDERSSKKRTHTLVAQHMAHPGFGEKSTVEEKQNVPAHSDNEPFSFVLVGNQNSGKTTLFNQLTGAHQRVGNFPGVTIEHKEARIKGKDHTLIDLPGLYSLSPYSNEEVLSREYIFEHHPSAIINIVDASNLERNLYLTMQLMELGIPMVVALNMMDEVQRNGASIHINLMESLLGVPVVPISALHGEGIQELIDHTIHVARYSQVPSAQDFCSIDDYEGSVHTCIHSVMEIVAPAAERAHVPLRFCATKVVEGDALILKELQLSPDEYSAIEHLISHMEQQRALDRAAAIADMRYTYIAEIGEQALVMPSQSKESKRSIAIDKILTGRFTAIPIFIAIMTCIFLLTFNVAGPFFQDVLQQGIDATSQWAQTSLETAGVNAVAQAFIVDGVLNGVGSVLIFFPIIVLMFFFLSLLQDTGYMARIAFLWTGYCAIWGFLGLRSSP